MLEMIFSRHNLKVLSASDGAEGLELAIKEKPDVIISDMLIPKVHGLDLCKKIKQDPGFSQTKVILMTAVYKSTTFKPQVKDAGADGFIEKPINTTDLMKLIDRFLEDKPEKGE